jgi:hypothetical protein
MSRLFIVLFVVMSEFFIAQNTTFEEWDGVMQLYSGVGIIETGVYSGWPSHFWPPLYPLLLGVVNEFGGGLFAFRQISLLSGVVLLSAIVVLARAYKLLSGGLLGILIGLLVTNWAFISSSVQVENHMLDTTLFLSAMGCLFVYAKRGEKNFGILSGLFAGLACNTRYTSYVLVFMPVFYCLLWRKFDKNLLLLFFSAFFIVCFPWWLQNYVINGSPLHTWQYLNIGSGVYSGSGVDWWWVKSMDYHSVFDVLKSDLYLYAKNFLKNIVHCIILSVKVSSGLVVIVLYGLIYRPGGIGDFNYRFMCLTVSIYAVFCVLVSQAFVFDQVFLSWGIVFTVMGVLFAKEIKIKGSGACLSVVVVASAVLSFSNIYYWSGDLDDGGQLAYAGQVNEVLLEAGACEVNNLRSCRVIAIHPERARSVGVSYSALPIGNGVTLDDVLNYKNLDSKIVESSPKWPTGPYDEVKNEFFVIAGLRRSLYSPWATEFKIDQCPSGLICYMPNDDLLIIRRNQ